MRPTVRKLTPTEWRAAIPSDLQRLARWVGRDGKTPLHPVREVGAKSGQPATWGTFDEVAAFYERHAAKPDRGAGFEFAAEDGLVGIDLDLALDEDGNPYQWAADLLAPFEDLGGAYIEVSPSGRGLHLITRAQLPHNPNRINYGGVTLNVGGKEKKSGVEVYRERRYFTMTGIVWRGNGAISDGQALVQGLLDVTGLTARMASRDVEGPAPQVGEEPEREEEIRSAVMALDPDMEYPDWINVGMALRSALGSTGFKIWNEWSATGSKYKYSGVHDLAFHWRSFKGHGITLGTLLKMAADAGWERPPVNAIQEFKEFVEDDYSDLLGGDAIDAFPKDDPDRIPYHVTKKGIAKTAGNIALFFSQDPTWKGRLRWNVRRGAELDGKLLEDPGYTILGTAAERALGFDGAAAVDHVYRGIEVAARRQEYDPIREFVLSAPWDGVPRIDDWLIRIGAKDTKINRMISRRFIIGMAGRALNENHPNQPQDVSYDTGTKFDYMLILEGAQGLRKTSLCEALSPPGYFFNSHISLTSGNGTKDFYDAIGRNYVIEVAELDAMGKAEASTVKGAVSARTDSFRPAYGRTTIRRARIAVLLGTTNDREWNKDVTGARRFWPVDFWHLDPTTPIDTEWVRMNLQQMLAEGAHYYRAGEIFWADAVMDALLAPLYRSRLNVSDWMDSAEAFVLSDEVQTHGWFTSHLIRQSDPFIKRTTGKMLNSYLRDVLHCHDIEIKIDGRVMRVWVVASADPRDAHAIVSAHPYAAIDAEFKVLP